jgi:hypothetical protein
MLCARCEAQSESIVCRTLPQVRCGTQDSHLHTVFFWLQPASLDACGSL